MTLPWDEFTPEQPAPAPSPPPPAPAPSEPPPPGVDFNTALHQALEDAWPALRDQAIGYAQDTAREIMAGHTVDVLHPTVTAQTSTGRELIVADAKSRSARTFIQGLAIDVFAAITVGIAALAGADPFKKETWVLLLALVAKTVIQSVASYVMRLKVTPTMRTEGEKLAIMPIPRPMIKE